MKRRSLIASIGVVTTGGVAIGTGAFTTAEAERTLNIEVAEEDSAVLAIGRINENDTGEFVQPLGQNNEVSFDFNNTAPTDGFGPGTESTYRFDRLFAVENQGSQTVYFQTEFEENEDSISDQELENIGIYVEEEDDNDLLLDGENAVLKLEVGEDAAELGFKIDTDGIDVELNDNEQITLDGVITASDEPPENVTILDSKGNVEESGTIG